jgi:hypothetical protein
MLKYIVRTDKDDLNIRNDIVIPIINDIIATVTAEATQPSQSERSKGS